ncbi:MAG: phage tail protein [Bacteroidota bacterium]
MADYPIPVFHFEVDWGGTKTAFSEVSGLNVTYEAIEYNDGLNPSYSSIKMPGRRTNDDITLKRGVFRSDNEFYDWWNTTKLNTTERRDITISLLDEEHAPVMVWKVTNAWVKKVDSPDLNAGNSEAALESVEVCHEGITIENG